MVIFGVFVDVRGDELEMLDHRVMLRADLARDLGAFVARRDRGEGDAGVHHVLLDAVEAPEEIEMPPRAAEFAVGDRLQAGLLLLPDDAFDLAVLDRLSAAASISPLANFVARLLQRRGAQQAADVVGAKGRLGALISLSSFCLRRSIFPSSAIWSRLLS